MIEDYCKCAECNKKIEYRNSIERHSHYHNDCLDKGPPLGIMPRFILEEKRLKELKETIIRYLEACLKVPKEWYEEYEDLLERKNKK